MADQPRVPFKMISPLARLRDVKAFTYGNTSAFSSSAVSMADREERRFAEVSRESVKLMAESAGVELGDDVAALLAEDVCYRLREATQVRVPHRDRNITATRHLKAVSRV